MNQRSPTRCFLFPHSVMAEHEARHLALLLPNLHLLEIVHPLQVPSWAQDHFTPHAILSDPDLVQRVKHYLRDYREFADVHQNTDTLALLQAQRIGEDSEENRIFLQDKLRGRPPKGPDMADWLRLEAASFLELARELDERELELEGHYRRMEELEEGFREILGTVDGDELDEVAEAASLPLAPDRNRLGYHLAKRSVSWYRLAGYHLMQPDTIMVALTREVTLELLDPMDTESERSGRPFSRVQRPLVDLPSIRHLAREDYLKLRHQLTDSGLLQPYWLALAEALGHPEDDDLRDAASHQGQLLRTRILEFCLECNTHPREQVVMVMNHVREFSHYDLWKSLDKTGFEHLVSSTQTMPETTTFLHLEWEGQAEP